MSSKIEVTKVCMFCGGEFTARTTKTQYCSHQCSSRAYKMRKREGKVAEVKREVAAIKAKPITDIKSKEYLNISDVCTLVGVSRWTIWRCIQQGDIHAVKLGRRVIIRRADIESLFAPELPPRPQPKTAPITEWCSVQDVMATYGLSRDMVYHYVKANKIPKMQEGRYVMLSKSHIDELFQPQILNDK